MRFRGIACAVATASALLATGCGGAEHAASLPKKSVAVTASPTATTVAQQVEAAVRHYYDVANQAFRTGDTTELNSLSVTTCPCRRLSEDVVRKFQSGRPDGLRFSVTRLQVHDVHGSTASALVTFRVAPYRQLDSTGRVIEQFSGGSARGDMILIERSRQWLITNAIAL